MVMVDGYLAALREQYELLEEKEQRELDSDEPVTENYVPDEDSFSDR